MKIAILDRHPALRSGLKRVLHLHFEMVTTMESESITLFNGSKSGQIPDVIILGLEKSESDTNLACVNMARMWYPKAIIIVLDHKVNLAMISKYLNAGVSGYLSKEAELKELITCITDVLNGEKYLNRDDLMLLLSNYKFEKKEKSFTRSNDVMLSRREIEIARYLAEGRKPSWISQKLGRKPSTISTIKSNIYKKLTVTNVLELRDRIRLMS